MSAHGTDGLVGGDRRTKAFAAVIGGLVGGILMALMIIGPGGGDALGLVAIMYGVSIESEYVAVVGLGMHVVHAVLLALLFAAVLSIGPVERALGTVADRVPRFGDGVVVAVVGALYGVVVWIVGWGYVMTEWLFRVGFQYYDPWAGWLGADTLVLHLVYAVPMALVYLAVSRRLGRTDSAGGPAPGAV